MLAQNLAAIYDIGATLAQHRLKDGYFLGHSYDIAGVFVCILHHYKLSFTSRPMETLPVQ